MKFTTTKNAFTMIELIFAIVIIGILSAVAIPKLTKSRDDALIVTDLSNLRSAKTSIYQEMLSGGALANLTDLQVECFDFTDIPEDNNITITASDSTETYCNEAVQRATDTFMMSNIEY